MFEILFKYEYKSCVTDVSDLTTCSSDSFRECSVNSSQVFILRGMCDARASISRIGSPEYSEMGARI